MAREREEKWAQAAHGAIRKLLEMQRERESNHKKNNNTRAEHKERCERGEMNGKRAESPRVENIPSSLWCAVHFLGFFVFPGQRKSKPPISRGFALALIPDGMLFQCGMGEQPDRRAAPLGAAKVAANGQLHVNRACLDVLNWERSSPTQEEQSEKHTRGTQKVSAPLQSKQLDFGDFFRPLQ